MRYIYRVTYFDYTSATRWCWNDGIIVGNVTWTLTPRTYFSFVDFLGHIGKTTFGGPGKTYFRDDAKGHFKWCEIVEVGDGEFPIPREVCSFDEKLHITKDQDAWGGHGYDDHGWSN